MQIDRGSVVPQRTYRVKWEVRLIEAKMNWNLCY